VAGASLAFLGLFWSRCADCDRPFRWWLLVHALLQILQVPVRVVFLRKLMASERVGGNVAQCVTSLTASPAWRSIRVVSFITYAWFILGIVWIMNAAPCSACPGITSLMAGLILQTIARVAVALIFSRTLFLQIPTAEQTRRVEAADPADVQACRPSRSRSNSSPRECLAPSVSANLRGARISGDFRAATTSTCNAWTRG